MPKVALVSWLILAVLFPLTVRGFSSNAALSIRSRRSKTFATTASNARFGVFSTTTIQKTTTLFAEKSKFSQKRREQMGIDDDDEYDVSVAISANTDSTITKIVAGSLIVVVIALLVVAVIIPSFQDYGGQCNPILTQGRC